ncbi:MAG: tRNA (adenosine(37)-N6)-threonylcarbamoyltransferase complex ATPase subunit type 1 TsaE [Bacteroidaceae bacterium]|nr:tRNA (adenosine(37)-N6)-threonylcarbamoyltransferase complex ATPase subunit type 1 TsaE [Bacteroidaceae bacterium]
MTELILPPLENIHQAARDFLSQYGRAKVIAFYGKMGAGKTTFIKALCDELQVTDVVNSPTFAIVNEYTSGINGAPIFHFDFYRIKRIEEVYDIGYEEYIESGNLCMIEWPELIEELLPQDCLRIKISHQ